MTALDDVLAKLDNPKQSKQSPSNWSAKCPAHDDGSPSLSISSATKGDPGAVVHCHAGCTPDQITAAIGMTVADLFDKRQESTTRPRQVGAYNYTDAAGQMVYRVARYEPKGFRPQTSDDDGWTWHNGYNGRTRILYRLPEVIDAVANSRPVYIVEGEKDADRLTAAGVCATTSPGGAKAWHHVADHAREVLADAVVIVVPDKDGPGEQYGRDVVQSLRDVVGALSVARAAIGKDAAEHLGAGCTVDQLELVASDHVKRDDSVTIDEWLEVDRCDDIDDEAPLQVFKDLPDVYKPQPLEWLVRGLLPAETHGEIGGAQKTLKSYIGSTIGVGVALGRPVLGQFEVPERRRVLLIAGEGGERMLLARLYRICHAYRAHWSDLVGWLRYTTVSAPITSPVFAQRITEEVEAFDPGFVNLDPWYVYGGGDANASQLGEIGERLETVRRTAGKGRALLINHHLNQTGTGTGIVKLAGAGHAEWVDSWLLLNHRTPPNVDAGQFRLSLEVGSRQWGGAGYDVDYDIGGFDTEHGMHDGDISWTVTARGHADIGSTDSKIAEAEKRVVTAWKQRRDRLKEPWTRTEWLDRTTGTKQDNRLAFYQLVDGRRILCIGDDPDARGVKWKLNEGSYGL